MEPRDAPWWAKFLAGVGIALAAILLGSILVYGIMYFVAKIQGVDL